MSVNSGYIYFDYIYVIIFSVLVVSVADGPSKQELVDYQIPINSLQPFHQYHLELVKASRSVSDHRVEVLILDPGPEPCWYNMSPVNWIVLYFSLRRAFPMEFVYLPQ